MQRHTTTASQTSTPRFSAVLVRKLLSKAGDSLVEALVAVLIAALGAATLATMVLSATTLISKSESEMTRVYESEQTLVSSANGQNETLHISGGDLSESIDIQVQVYTNSDGDLIRYEVSEP